MGSVEFDRFIYRRKVGIAHVYLKQHLGLHALFMGKERDKASNGPPLWFLWNLWKEINNLCFM